ncbi:hypothetical protein GIB67_023358 [Kingdonia uniflora]|uniref:Transmembrane protein n=1 Tax=Kingdonia uniflora TaxID=39325 RepID=A0A7J7LI62_9MAGN|nr:hypothetical protein GIB67_023358 [Kingdonia uniflora]
MQKNCEQWMTTIRFGGGKNMALASSFQQSFLISSHKHNNLKSLVPVFSSCRSSVNDDHHDSTKNNEMGLAKIAFVTLTAGVLTLGSVHEVLAAKTGGRVGGQAFRSAAPRQSSPRINNSRTNIYINPRVAPPLVGGYGYGYGVPFYGGWSPFSFFAPGPSVAVGIGGGFDTIVLFMFLGAIAAVFRKFSSSRDEEDDDY